MSYDIELRDPATGAACELAESHQMRGGTYPVGGTPNAEINITYNYSTHFCRVLGENGIRGIYGMTGAESIPVLLDAAANLRDDTDPDYWKATEGNARQALLQLLALAEMKPEGVWHGD